MRGKKECEEKKNARKKRMRGKGGCKKKEDAKKRRRALFINLSAGSSPIEPGGWTPIQNLVANKTFWIKRARHCNVRKRAGSVLLSNNGEE